MENDSFEQTSSSSEADWVENGDDDYSIDSSVDGPELGKSNISAKVNNIVFACQTWNNSSSKERSPC